MLEREEICLEKVNLGSNLNRRFLAEEVGGIGCVEGRQSDRLMILQSLLWKSNKKKFSFGRIKGEVVR